jgi:hypothetical protein
MISAANDNLDPVAQPLPRLVGWVGDGGRVTFGPPPATDARQAPLFPMDPRED